MSSRHIALADPRRHRRGNRTLRMPQAAWLTICSDKLGWPRDAPNQPARDISRINDLHTGRYPPRSDMTLQGAIAFLIHGAHWKTSPSIQRKAYAGVIRDILRQLREGRERLRSYAQSEQNFSRIPR